MNRVPRPTDETAELFREQIGYITKSAREFDQGDVSEAKRIAVALRVLLYDYKQSKSLFSQIGIKETFWFLDSAGESDGPGPLGFNSGLTSVEIELGGGSVQTRYTPYLQVCPSQPLPPQAQVNALLRGIKLPRRPGTHQRFETWWGQTVIWDQEENQFSRWDLVSALANTDGGAHVDAGLDPKYLSLSRLDSLGVMQDDHGVIFFGGGGHKESTLPNLMSVGSPVPASIRQIAWELLTSLKNQRPDLLPNKGARR